MLMLGRKLVDELIRHAREEHPIEACGYIAGKVFPERIIRMENDEESDTLFAFGEQEQLRVMQEMNFRGEQVFAIYHSHTGSGNGEHHAYPSDRDRRYLWVAGPNVLHVIAGTKDPLITELRAYRFLPVTIPGKKADVEEVQLLITNEHAALAS